MKPNAEGMAMTPFDLNRCLDVLERTPAVLERLLAGLDGLWTRGNERPELRFLQPDQPALTRARLAMIEAVRVTLAAGLAILGVTPVEELR